MEDIEEDLYNETINGTGIYYFDHIPVAVHYIDETVLFLAGLIGIFFNLALAVCIIKFKNMQNRLNTLICHICISNVFSYFFNSSTFSIFVRVFDVDFNYKFFCFVYNHLTTFYAVSSVLMLLISLDVTFEKCTDKSFNRTLISIWSFTLLHVIIKTVTCMLHTNLVLEYFDLLVFLVVNSIIAIRCLIHFANVLRKKVENKSCRQTICGIYVLTIIIAIISGAISHSFYGIILVHLIFKWLFQVVFCQPLLYIYVLSRYDENVRICLKNAAMCNYRYFGNRIKYNTELDEVETLPNSEVTISTTNPIVNDETRRAPLPHTVNT